MDERTERRMLDAHQGDGEPSTEDCPCGCRGDESEHMTPEEYADEQRAEFMADEEPGRW